MPWQPESLNKLIEEAKNLIIKYFKVEVATEVYLCSRDEMSKAVLEELKKNNRSDKTIDHIKKIYLKRIIGKYFAEKNEIWLLEGIGDTIEVLVHELMHSIQKCTPNREKIVDYLTYKLTSLKNQIPEETLREWTDIEKTYSFKVIVNQLLEEKDCEDFDD